MAIVTRDAFPVSPGHMLIIPRWRVASYFDTTAEERSAMFELLENANMAIDGITPKQKLALAA